MTWELLRAELDTDPLSRGYASMSDKEVATDLNTVYRTKARDYVSGWEIFNATDYSEYAALTDSQKASWDALCSIESIDTTSGIAKAKEAELFGAGTTTRSNLVTLRSTDVSRAVELGFGEVTAGQVEEARRL